MRAEICIRPRDTAPLTARDVAPHSDTFRPHERRAAQHHQGVRRRRADLTPFFARHPTGIPYSPAREADGHRHAHIFSESIGSTNAHITHVTVYAQAGFDRKAVDALRSILWTWGFKNHELRLVLYGFGQPADFPDCRLFAKAKVWRSLTPFVSTRHAKTFAMGDQNLVTTAGRSALHRTIFCACSPSIRAAREPRFAVTRRIRCPSI